MDTVQGIMLQSCVFLATGKLVKDGGILLVQFPEIILDNKTERTESLVILFYSLFVEDGTTQGFPV